MATDASSNTVPKSGKKTKKCRADATYSKGKGSAGGRAEEVAKKLAQSARRMHQAAKISENRPEILAMLDFKPLYASGGDLTLAGKMFDARVSERAQTLETISTLLKDLEVSLPDEFTAALNQYSSALAATEADITLLKLMILLRQYATHTARFLEFRDEYTLPEGLDLDFLGSDAQEWVRNGLNIKAGTFDGNRFWKTASVPLLQIMSDIPLCSYAIIPYQLSKKQRTSGAANGVARKFQAYEREELPTLTLAFVVRDMLASYEFVKLRIGDEVDEEFVAICDEVLGSGFLTSTIAKNFTAFYNLIGEDPWGRVRKNSNTDSMGLNQFTEKRIRSMLMARWGVEAKMQVSIPGHPERVLFPESVEQSFNDKDYQTLDAMVDDAFSGEPPLNFEKFNEKIGEFTTSMRDLETFGKTLFRMGEKVEDAGYATRGYTLVADDMPLSMGSSAAAVLDVWNRRFVSIFYNSAYKEIPDLAGEQHVMFNRMIAWFMIRDDWSLAYSYVNSFFTDYKKGFLTASGLPEEIVIDEETGETETSPTAYVLPGTDTPANISTIGTSLGGKISRSEDAYYEEQAHFTTSIKLEAGNLVSNGPNVRNFARNIFGTDGAGVDGVTVDLRTANPMYLEYDHQERSKQTRRWMASKIVAAEIIDAVLEVMRTLMAPLGEVEAVPDGDPIFPSLTTSKTPYGDGTWSFCDPMYDGLATEMWVPTVEKWHELFARSTSKDTYFRETEFNQHAKNIVLTLSSLMQHFDMIELVRAGKGITSASAVISGMNFEISGLSVRGGYDHKAVRYTDFFKNVDSVIDNILESTWDDIDDLEAPTYSTTIEDTSDSSLNMVIFVDDDKSDGDGSGSPTTTEQMTGTPEFGVETIRDEVSESRAWINRVHDAAKSFIINARQNDMALEFLYDFVGDYADRVDNYNTAVQALVAGEDSSLGVFVNSVLEAGDAGVDLLQNITPNQLALKQIALSEERGDEDNAHMPALAILTSSEVDAVRILARGVKAISPEGDNTKIIMVGLPAGMFDTLEIEDEFAIRVSYIDIEYPQLVFLGKTYPFKKDLYVTPTDLETSLSGAQTIDDVVDRVALTSLTVTVEESSDTTASISIEDEETRVMYNLFSGYDKPHFVNHVSSEIIKIYCRIMLGLNFSESAFLGTVEGIQIPINDYAANLAESMATGLETIGELSEDLSGTAIDLMSDLSTIEDDAFVSGELEAVDESLITSLRDAFQTRLFSAEIMKSRVLSAKLFDRIFALAIDPDEFYIATPDDTDASGVTTSQQILDFYLEKGVVEETGLDAPFRYKLAPRTTGEGRMAFGKFFVSVISTPTNFDRIFE